MDVIDMSPRTGRPPKFGTTKSEGIYIRLTKEKAERLKKCAERLGISRNEAIERGIDLLEEENNDKSV